MQLQLHNFSRYLTDSDDRTRKIRQRRKSRRRTRRNGTVDSFNNGPRTMFCCYYRQSKKRVKININIYVMKNITNRDGQTNIIFFFSTFPTTRGKSRKGTSMEGTSREGTSREGTSVVSGCAPGPDAREADAFYFLVPYNNATDDQVGRGGGGTLCPWQKSRVVQMFPPPRHSPP